MQAGLAVSMGDGLTAAIQIHMLTPTLAWQAKLVSLPGEPAPVVPPTATAKWMRCSEKYPRVAAACLDVERPAGVNTARVFVVVKGPRVRDRPPPASLPRR